MAVGLNGLSMLAPVSGIRTSVAKAGIKKPNRRDVVLFEIADGASVSGVFTRNAFCAAPVRVAKSNLGLFAPRYFLINTGNANAGTGANGELAAKFCCEQLAKIANCKTEKVLPFSTGVIGEPLPVEKISAVLPDLLANLSVDSWVDAAHGIMTTDTVPKGISKSVELNGHTVTVTGIAKGSGMIRPDMATMLAFIATDAAVEQAVLDKMLQKIADKSFNRVTVDGDTSTNDACMLVATGMAENKRIGDFDSPEATTLADTIIEVAVFLAQALIRDGEGATKFVTVDVDEGANVKECLDVAYTIAQSPLVKTAIFAGDPNWGRILAAIGRSGLDDLVVDKISIWLDDVCIVEDGGRAESYTESEGQRVLSSDEFTIYVKLSRGICREQIWTCDFSYDYVKINAEYRT